MPVTTEFIENGHVLKCTLSDFWTMEDIYQIARDRKPACIASPFRVHVLVDMTQISHVPPGFLSVRSRVDWNHSNSGHIAIAGAVGMVRLMIELVVRLLPGNKASLFDTEADAVEHLRSLIAGESP